MTRKKQLRIEWIDSAMDTSWPRVGKVSCGFIFLDKMFTSRGDTAKFRWSCNLPSLRAEFASGETSTMEEAKKKLERVIRRWFKTALGE